MAVKSGSQTDEALELIERFSEVRETVVQERKKRLSKLEKAAGNNGKASLPSYRSGQHTYGGKKY